MKSTKFVCLFAVLFAMLVAVSPAADTLAPSTDLDRRQSQSDLMLHKLGRGIVNVLTCWVEVPRNIAHEWERTDPATGFVLGTVKGIGWGFTRFATGVYDTFTFPFPVPPGYASLLDPEFVITDVWGDPIPGISDFGANDPDYPSNAPVYPERFNF